jgi:thioredoxin-dependent peroxiredoxin
MKVGDKAPDFVLDDDQGQPTRLSELLAEGPVVLYFYPKAMTSGCTKESCHFRDLAAEFSALGARRVGISADQVSKQREFSEKHDFDFPLLSDPDRKVAQLFGVKRSLVPVNKRATFVIGSDGVVKEIIASELNMDVHADRALETLRKL